MYLQYAPRGHRTHLLQSTRAEGSAHKVRYNVGEKNSIL